MDAGCGLCGAAPCPVRPGEPRVLVSSSDRQITAIAVSADTLYYGTGISTFGLLGEIRAVALAGGASRLLVTDVIVSSLHPQGSTLYYVDRARSIAPTTLFAVPTAGGDPKLIAQGLGLEYVVFDAMGIYLGDRGTIASRITHTDRNGSSPTPVVDIVGVLWGFEVDEANVYWAEFQNGGRLLRRSLGGGDTATLSASLERIASPLIDGADIDYVEVTSTPAMCGNRLMAVPKAGDMPARQISPGSISVDVTRLVRDESHVYWASTNQGAILRTRKGEPPEILAVNQQGAGGLALGPTDAYWIARTGTVYEVRTVPK